MLLGVRDSALEAEMTKAAKRGDRSAVIFGSAFEPAGERPANGLALGSRLSEIARDAGMALCGAGCMGFVNVVARSACDRVRRARPDTVLVHSHSSAVRDLPSRRCCARVVLSGGRSPSLRARSW